MKVTVAIPCYNGAAYVGATIESVLAQSRPPDEITVIDDGSTDASVEVISKYPVRLIQHDGNKGLAAARNTALAGSTGDIIAFIDVDAPADPTWLETLLSGYTAEDVAGVGGRGIETRMLSPADRWRRLHASQGHGERVLERAEFLHGLNSSFRVHALRTVGGFDPRFCTNAEDLDVGLRLNRHGFRLRYLPDARVYHQRTDTEETLLRTMGTWYAAAYEAKCKNDCRPWTLFAGTLRRLCTEPVTDILIEKDPALARLSLRVGWGKLVALWNASR